MIRRLEDTLLVVLLLGLILFAGAQIGARNLFDGGWMWGDQAIRLGVLWVGLLGAVVASREDRHLRIDLVPRALPPRARALLAVVTHALTAGVCGTIAFHCARFVLEERAFAATGPLDVPLWILQAILPVGFLLMTVSHARHAWRAARA